MRALRIDGRSLAALPGVISGVFPTLVCPGCWPAYTTVLSAVGLPFIPTGAYLFPATIEFLGVAVIGLALGRRRSHRSRPLLLGVLGSSVVILGKFVLAIPTVTYSGVALLLTASVWNSRPGCTSAPVCSNCSSKAKHTKGRFESAK
jgi:mercuric ion transport protein